MRIQGSLSWLLYGVPISKDSIIGKPIYGECENRVGVITDICGH